MEFARDPISARAVASAVAWLEEAPSGHRWILIDSALLETSRLRSTLSRHSEVQFNAFSSSVLSAFGEFAPRLFRIDSRSDAEAVLDSVVHLDPTSPAATFIRSRVGPSSVLEFCSALAIVDVQGGLTLHCRFADARTLSSLFKVLDPSQSARVAKSVAAWGWFDSLGSFSSIAFSPSASNELDTLRPSTPLTLADSQFESMLRDSEPDLMFAQLLSTTPELVPAVGRGSFRAALAALLSQADDLGVLQPPDRLQFLVLGLTCGQDFHHLSTLQPTWRAVRDNGESLTTIMSTWSDSTWRELEQGAKVGRGVAA